MSEAKRSVIWAADPQEAARVVVTPCDRAVAKRSIVVSGRSKNRAKEKSFFPARNRTKRRKRFHTSHYHNTRGKDYRRTKRGCDTREPDRIVLDEHRKGRGAAAS